MKKRQTDVLAQYEEVIWGKLTPDMKKLFQAIDLTPENLLTLYQTRMLRWLPISEEFAKQIESDLEKEIGDLAVARIEPGLEWVYRLGLVILGAPYFKSEWRDIGGVRQGGWRVVDRLRIVTPALADDLGETLKRELSEDLYAVLMWRMRDGLGVDEIARRNHRSTPWVYWRINRILAEVACNQEICTAVLNAMMKPIERR